MFRPTRKTLILLAVVTLCLIGFAAWPLVRRGDASQEDDFDWRSDWAAVEGFSLGIDTEGYEFPTAIAFVPQPGPGPKDPLYFVTELRGRVKVVTNDRSIYTFAENFFQLDLEKNLPDVEGESGLAGICLAPEQGYVYVTFAYQDAQGILRNNVMRFESKAQTFSLEPTGQLAFTDVFADYETAISHQIGSCQVAGESLYVSVGDGRQTSDSQNVDSLLGKVLRMTLDGQPAPGNPFYADGNTQTDARYVWASGFRNPFGLKSVGDQLFVADNGSDLDRFVQIHPGENYLWDGDDWSIGARADLTLSPDVGPVQVDYSPIETAGYPEDFTESFFIATSRPELAGVLRVKYNLEEGRASGAPEFFVRYQGEGHQIVAGAAIGPEGLYFAPTMPNAEGRSAVILVEYNPEQGHPYLISETTDPQTLMWEKGCLGCHELDREGGTAGPALDRDPMVDRLEARLNSPDYSQDLAEVDRLDREPFANYKNARAEVVQAEGREKLRTWMIYHIMEPRFDNPYSQMPNLGLSKTEATILTDYLLQEDQGATGRMKAFILRFLPSDPMPRHILFAFALGGVAGGLFLGGAAIVGSRLMRRRRSGSDERGN